MLHTKICKNPECKRTFKTKYATKKYCRASCSYRSWFMKNRLKPDHCNKYIDTHTGIEVKNDILGKTMVRKTQTIYSKKEEFSLD